MTTHHSNIAMKQLSGEELLVSRILGLSSDDSIQRELDRRAVLGRDLETIVSAGACREAVASGLNAAA